MRRSKTILVISLLTLFSVFFSRCFRQNNASDDLRGYAYAGTKTCMTCHKDIFNSYTHSNHYRTSSAINNDSLKKITAIAKGNFYYKDSSYVRMEESDSAIFQSYYVHGQKTMTGKFDIAFGSGEKAQTFAFWEGDKLKELPLTYFTTAGSWANSPGYPASHALYDRIIESRCFECHASYIKREFVQTGSLEVGEKLDRNFIVYGIDCERCHGPASAHVQYHTENTSAKKGMYITSINSLTRQQKLDVCASCHSGNDKAAMKSIFGFQPGDTLSNFYYPDFESDKNEPDVHGKQMQLLKASVCFQNSNMTCNTCHNAHESGTNQMTQFVSKCMDCHQNDAHAKAILKENEQSGQATALVNKNCIDCHMPLQESKIISFNNGAEAKTSPYFLRTHKIAIYK